MAQLQPPSALSFEGNIAENWKLWEQKFDLFLIASGIAEKSSKVQCATFLHVAGEEAVKIYNTFSFEEAEKDKLDVLKKKFKDYCEPRKNVTYIRHLFFTRAQGPNESIDAYVTDLKNKAKDCEFLDLHDSLIRDRIVCGVREDHVRARLLRETGLTLVKAIDICRANEMTVTQVKALNEEVEVSKIRSVSHSKTADRRKTFGNDYRARTNVTGNEQKVRQCFKCGYEHSPSKCPAYGQTCRVCNKQNHFAKMCRQAKQQASGYNARKLHVVEVDDDDDDDFFVGSVELKREENPVKIETIATETKSDKARWTERLNINGQNVSFKLDTGAECNVLAERTFRSLGCNTTLMKKSGCKLVTYSGHQMSPVGKVTLTCKYKEIKHEIDFQIIDRDAPAILGRETCEALGMIKRVHEIKSEDELLNKFDDLFTGLGCLPGQHHIQINKDIPPVVHAPRRVPVALKSKIVEELQRMEKLGVITRQHEPTDWVNSMVTVVKPNKIRICIDPKDLNQAIKREHYPLLTVEEVVSSMPKAKVFSVVDANHGFWQIQLDEESSKLCTFNTPIGRYRFLRLPFGVSSASEVFQRAVAQMIEGLDGVVNVIDDLLVWGENDEEHDRRLVQLLNRAREWNLKLNKSKCKIRTPEIRYIGHILSAEGLKPDPEKVRAVAQIPTPENKQALMRFMGMIQYLAKFIPNMAEVSAPLRKLLESDVDWHWEDGQVRSFEKLKSLLTHAPTLKFYDVQKPVTLSVDASSEGIGAVLMQEGKPVAYGSRALSDAQRRYAQIEKELLAIVYGCEKFHQYVYGKDILVESDHKPLEAIFKKALYQAPSRLQRMLLRLQRYSLNIVYKPGKEMHIADALSRAFLNEQTEDLLGEELEVNWVTQQLPVSEEKLNMFREATAADPEMQLLHKVAMNGWPKDINAVHKDIQAYWTYREEISCSSGLLFKAAKLIVPNQLRGEMLSKIHESHLGVVKCKERARDVLYWPGMSKQIENLVLKCTVCDKNRNSNPKEPLIPHELPDRPWSKVGTDLFHFNGKEYLLCIDYYSKFPEIVKLTDTTARGVITGMKSIFSRHGIPDRLVSDNGPQYSCAEFRRFAGDWDFRHLTSSPGHAQSNGQAERTVQTVKNLLRKAQDGNGDPYIALLEYRNTPLEGVGYSPAQLLMGRRLKSKLPTTTALLTPESSIQVSDKLKEKQLKQKSYYDRQTRCLPDLHKGESVRVQRKDGWQPAVVLHKHEQPRSFVVQTPDGSTYRRNRKHLRKTRETECATPMADADIDIKPEVSHSNTQVKTEDEETADSKPQLEGDYFTRSGRQVKVPDRYKP